MTMSSTLLASADRWGHMDGWGGGWMWLSGVMMMAGFAILIVWLVRSSTQHTAPPPLDSLDRARSILAERYAHGDVTTEEYRERLDALR